MAAQDRTDATIRMPVDVVIFAQINDVYHIDVAADSRRPETMILPRIATMVKRLRSRYGDHRVHACVPGDFLSPSYLSRLFAGKQMVATLNTVGIDFVSVGNHEFDIRQGRDDPPSSEDGHSSPRALLAESLKTRIDESRFKWLWTNLEPEGTPEAIELAKRFAAYHVIRLSERTDLLLIGLLYADEHPGVGRSLPPIDSARTMIPRIAQSIIDHSSNDSDFLCIALTHQTLEEDRQLAQAVPQIHMIMGGHDHNVEELTDAGCLILKTASNARTVRLNFVAAVELTLIEQVFGPGDLNERSTSDLIDWIVESVASEAVDVVFGKFDLKWREAAIDKDNICIQVTRTSSEMVFLMTSAIDTSHPHFLSIPPEPEVVGTIEEWLLKIERECHCKIAKSPTKLIAEDRSLRRGSTNFGILVAEILRGRYGSRREDIAMLNSGAIRLDRTLLTDEWVTERVVLETFFHDNEVIVYSMSGSAVVAVLQRSNEMRLAGGPDSEGDGHFLQVSGVCISCRPDVQIQSNDVRLVASMQPIDANGTYRVVTTSYIAKGSPFSTYFVGLCGETIGSWREYFASALPRAFERYHIDFGEDQVRQGWT